MKSMKIPQEAARTLHVVREHLDDALIGAYLFGSAVDGGLKPDSDVDVFVVMDGVLTEPGRKQLVRDMMTVSAPTGSRESGRPIELSIVNFSDIVPWQYPPKSQLVYGEWLRKEFEQDHIPGPERDPDLAIVIHKVRKRSVTLTGRDASEILQPVPATDIRKAVRESLPNLLAGIKGDERNTVLTLTRMWFTMATGEISSKDAAAKWAMTQLPEEQAALLETARQAYLGNARDDWNGERVRLAALVASLKSAIETCTSS